MAEKGTALCCKYQRCPQHEKRVAVEKWLMLDSAEGPTWHLQAAPGWWGPLCSLTFCFMSQVLARRLFGQPLSTCQLSLPLSTCKLHHAQSGSIQQVDVDVSARLVSRHHCWPSSVLRLPAILHISRLHHAQCQRMLAQLGRLLPLFSAGAG